MRHHDTRWITRLLAASFLGTALLGTPAISAAEEEQGFLTPSKDELLMFWDEKELYVQTATRSEKPINQVAENMTVITAKDIEVMNANSVDEVLARVPGLFASFAYVDYASSAQLQIQGSEPRHVTVLLDGMPVNLLNSGGAVTNMIPLRIVERIEIIKGAASSAWGSGLGGVVNIITRSTGDNATPNGMFGGSWGEASSRNGEAELRGKNGPLGYYLYAGQQGSDGLVNSRSFQRSSIFGKVLLTPTRDLDITLSGSFSNPEMNDGDVPSKFINGLNKFDTSSLNSSFEFRATPELTVRGGLHLFNAKFDAFARVLQSAPAILSPGQLFKQNIYDEQTMGANLRATWNSGIQTLTVGAEGSHGTLDQTTNNGPFLQNYKGFIPTDPAHAKVDKWGIFANDTVEFGPLAVTPGIRLDHDSFFGVFISPSVGSTLELSEHTVARASVARGFTSPPLSYLGGGGQFYTANPNLKAEYGWSYQAGLESGVADLVNLKGTIFYHDTTNAIVVGSGTSANGDTISRLGYELEADTVPFYNLSLKAGHAYVHVKGDSLITSYAHKYFDNYSWLIGIKYDDRQSFSALLSGNYIYWDLDTDPNKGINSDKYTTFIWDLTATKKFQLDEQNKLETFFTVHNIFSGDRMTLTVYPNPGRWVEGGLRFRF
ncbi:MAG: hypothetical protein A2076_17370 [Geobacteraceae bacterium GWC2_53_11]|nr:MAG: hypothetical protein A2076_17370 [Geobacteraceae bacterium GWC2_53_11]